MRFVGWAAVIYAVQDAWSFAALIVLVLASLLLQSKSPNRQTRRSKRVR